MKVKVTEKCELIIDAENASEALALRYWYEGFKSVITDENCRSSLKINASTRQEFEQRNGLGDADE